MDAVILGHHSSAISSVEPVPNIYRHIPILIGFVFEVHFLLSSFSTSY